VPRGTVIEIIPAARVDVFRLLHDYSRRLEWDTLLQAASLTDGFTEAGLGAHSICKGRLLLGAIAMKTVYVSFRPPDVAAVKLVDRPPFFDMFAATIRHRDLGDDSSTVEYKYRFAARPSWLRWVLHPVMQALFRFETKRRLRALRKFFVTTSETIKATGSFESRAVNARQSR
jgi:hypothetical protein